MVLVLTGCNHTNQNQNQNHSIPNSTESIQSLVTFSPSKPTSTPIDWMELNNFQPIKERVLANNFKITKFGPKDKTKSFSVDGTADLNGDGHMDQIHLFLRGIEGDYGAEAYIQVNQVRQTIAMDFTFDGAVELLDLDQDDHTIEIAAFDAGPSDEAQFHVFQYDGNHLYSLGAIDAGSFVNHHGKVISGFFVTRFTPRFYSAWYEVIDHSFQMKANDITPYFGKSYVVDGDAFFFPSEQLSFENWWDKHRTFHNQSFKLLDVGFYPTSRILNNYFIEFEDGTKGMLNFWIGD